MQMLESIKLTFADMLTPRITNLVIYILISSLIIFFLIIFVFWYLIPDLGYIGNILGFFFIGTLNFIWLFFIFSIATILFIPISTLISSLYSDKIIQQIEGNHYFYTTYPLKEGFWCGTYAGIKLLLWTSLIIIFLTPLLWIFSIGKYFSIILWIMINGYFIGKEYFELVAIRRLESNEIIEFRTKNYKRLYLGGLLCSLIFSIPILNLVAPAFTTIFTLHEFNKIKQTY